MTRVGCGGRMLGGREATSLRGGMPSRTKLAVSAEKAQATWVLGLALPLGFAWLMTCQTGIGIALLGRAPRWRGWVSLLPPLAPLALYWALSERMYIRAGLWGVSLVLYLATLMIAYI
jgi:hypothetical protein